MRTFVLTENIRRFRAMLAIESSPDRRRCLESLLREAAAELAELQRISPASPPSVTDPGNPVRGKERAASGLLIRLNEPPSERASSETETLRGQSCPEGLGRSDEVGSVPFSPSIALPSPHEARPGDSLLLTDLYQLTMLEAYLEHRVTDIAVFELFVRKLPARRGFLMAAGLEQALQFLETVRVGPDELAWLERDGRFKPATLDWLAEFRFQGDVEALPEGTALFGDEPLLRVTASLPAAQLVESRLMNILHFQSLIASKAARMRLAAPGKQLVDFGFRRAHGAEAGLMAARAAYVAGFDATATVLAGALWDIPLSGTMAHSFVQAFEDESGAFEAFARARPEGVTLLLDTYDTVAAARKVVTLASRLRADGIRIEAVRLDSGDLVALSRSVRAILDAGGLAEVAIFASGGLDEDHLAAFRRAEAPIDGFGVGTSLTTSSDAPALDCAYKLQAYAGVPRRKLSAGKATWPGPKQVWRRYAADGRMDRDTVSTSDDLQDGEPLLQPVMRQGHRVSPPPGLEAIRQRAADSLRRLPEPLRRLEPARYPVEIAPRLRRLAEEVDRRLQRGAAPA